MARLSKPNHLCEYVITLKSVSLTIPAAAELRGIHLKIILFVLVLGTLMGALDSTIVILAFPVIAEKLNSDIATTIWIILIYLLVAAVATTPLGRVGDIYGRSKMFNAGFVIFTLGSAFCGRSSSIKLLILSRGLQALGGSLLQANSGAIIADVFPRNERGRAFGYNSLGWTSGAMIGIVLGGLITTFLGWEYIFFINIPIGLVIMYLQGVRGLSPLNASILLIPGYVVGSLLSPFMGKLSDKYGARAIASIGIAIIGVAIFVYLMLRQDSSLYLVMVASAISGFGTSMFFPANNSAVMASAHVGSYGSIPGLLRTLQNIGILGSFVMAISVASASIPRSVAFEIFTGTTNLDGLITPFEYRKS